jgi:hypothetical protein
MATIIKIKRSSGTSTPNLGQGEIGYSWGTGTYTDAQSATVTSYGKMYLGTGTETGGIAANIEVIGGKYFTDMLDHGHGTLTANSAVLLDSAKKVNEFFVDNLGLDGNTISSTNTDGDINLDPNGTGEVVIPDDTYLTFGTSKDTKIKYDEATDDRLEVTGADWNFANGVAISLSDTTASTTSSTGALVVTGGVGIGGSLNVAGSISAGTLASPSNLTVSGDLTVQGGDINVTQVATNINIKDNTSGALVIKEGTNQYLNITTTDASELITFSTANVDIDNDLNVDGGDLTTNQTTFNLLNTNATTVNAFGAATTIEIGAATGTTNINNNLDVDGDINIDGGDLTVSTTTFNLANANATTVNFAGAATTVEIGAATGTTNINNNLDVDGDVNIDGGDLTVSTTTFNLANSTATTVNAFGAATTVEIGAATGTTNINNNLDVDGDVNIDGGDLTVSTTTFNLANATATTVNFAGAATTIEIGAATGTTNINNNLDVDGDVNIDGGDLTVSTSTFNLANTNATTVNFAGAAQTLNIGTASTEVDFGDLRILGSTIYSDNASSQTITIDPFPAGGNQAGNVVVRGNLQVSGTTTTVNSTQMTINDPIFTLGDSISEKTVVSAAASGQNAVVLDDVDGLNVGDIVSGNAAIPNGTTIATIDTGTKTITLSANLTAGIPASVNNALQLLTFTQGADDNRDRGIEFKYYNGSLKTGFFGYDESGISEDTTNYYFTYIPDATNTNNVFSGTVGSAYFKTVKLDDGVLNGVAFFDQYKRLTRTVAAGTSDVNTSNQILTVNGSGVPVWTTTLDGGTY